MLRRLVIGMVVLVVGPAAALAQGPSCSEFRVDSTGAFDFADPAVAATPGGGFVAVWRSAPIPGPPLIQGRRFDASGTPLGPEFPINTQPFGRPTPAIAMDGVGNFVVVWAAVTDVVGRRFDAAGVPQGPEFIVGTGLAPSALASVAVNPAGEFVVAWGGATVSARRYDAAGVPQGPAFTVDPSPTIPLSAPSVAYPGHRSRRDRLAGL
jgi:hypothetical protein